MVKLIDNSYEYEKSKKIHGNIKKLFKRFKKKITEMPYDTIVESIIVSNENMNLCDPLLKSVDELVDFIFDDFFERNSIYF